MQVITIQKESIKLVKVLLRLLLLLMTTGSRSYGDVSALLHGTFPRSRIHGITALKNSKKIKAAYERQNAGQPFNAAGYRLSSQDIRIDELHK